MFKELGCFVTIRIFARTEQERKARNMKGCFVTIRIFARTEPLLIFKN